MANEAKSTASPKPKVIATTGGAPAGEFKSTASPKTKVIAATGGAAVGSAFSVVLIWILGSVLNKLGITLPDNVTAAFNTIFTTIVTLAAGYYTPPGASEGVVVNENGSVRSALK
jgi:hypothetical protein